MWDPSPTASVCSRPSSDTSNRPKPHFEAALEHHELLGSPPFVALTRAGYAHMLRAQGGPGDHDRADELGSQTNAIAHELGMKLPDDEHWPVSLR